MTNNVRPEIEDDLMRNILHDEGGSEFSMLRAEMGKSTSAPPPGLMGSLISPSPDFTRGERLDITASEDYYKYYYSLKPHDPRLPLPKWKPEYTAGPLLEHIQTSMMGNHGGLRKTSLPEKSNDMNNFASHFDQAMSLNMNKPSSPQMNFEKKQILQPRPIQESSPNANANFERMNHQMSGHQQSNKQSHYQQHGHQHQQHQQHGHQQQQYQQQNYNRQHQQYGQQNQYNQQNQQGGYYQKPHPQNMKNFDQGQYYPGMDQMGSPFMNPGFMNPQMQMQPNPYYGVNSFQPQMYPYNVGPNVMPNSKQFGNMPNQYGGFRMNQMDQMNMGMGQVGGMNQFYNNNYGNNPYQMGGYQQNSQMNYQQNFGNHQQNKNQKVANKNNIQKLDIKNVLAHLIENCRDQNGSRLIQQQFEKSNEQEKEQIFLEILPHAYSLMTDVFGNYVIQKILELGTVDQKLKFFEAMQGNIYELSKHTYGCRVVQRTLEELKGKEQVQNGVLEEISVDVISLIEDQNGNHVIQKCFETMPTNKVQFILEEVTKNIDTLAFHSFGCRVIQRILEHSPPETTAPMLNRLMSSALKCCEDQFGNYIMQYILEKGPKQEKNLLLDVLKKNFTRLSMNKFASNVTEKSAINGTLEFKGDIVNVLCNTYYDTKLSLVALMTHSFANYVVQKLFEYSDDKLRQILYEKIQANIEDIKKSNFGKHGLTSIEKVMMESRKHKN